MDDARVSEHRIPIIYSRIIASAVGRRAAELRQVLPEAPAAAVAGYMTGAQYEALLRAARRLSGDPLIALKAGANIPFSVHGPLGIAAMSSPTLGEALAVITRYAVLRSPFCRIDRHDADGEVVFSFHMDGSLHDQSDAALDFIISTIGRSIATLVAEPLTGFRLELQRERSATTREYIEILGCEVVFYAGRDAFVMPAAALSTPLRGANPEVFAEALARLRAMHLPHAPDASLQDRIVDVFVSRTGHLCSLAEVAQSLGTSPRTLQRRLRAQGSSFEGLREAWLSRQALDLLMRERLSVEVTATLLGYSEIANFRRSFRRWFGAPPSAYRRDGALTGAK